MHPLLKGSNPQNGMYLGSQVKSRYRLKRAQYQTRMRSPPAGGAVDGIWFEDEENAQKGRCWPGLSGFLARCCQAPGVFSPIFIKQL